MKRFFKIFGLSFACVIVGLALLIGGAYLFGAFTEKPVKPKDIAFVQETVTTSSATALRVTTKTENVNQKKIKIDVAPSGIVECPKYVTLDEDFVIWPVKDSDGYNVGGIVTITASFEGMHVSNCIVKVDVPVSDLVVVTEHTSLSKGEQISFGTNVIPARALSPWKTDIAPDNPNLYDDRSKVIYYYLYNEENTLMDTSYAYFYSSGRQTNALSSKQINAQTCIVAQKECTFYVKAFCFSTFAREDYYNVQSAEEMIYSDGRQEIQEKYLSLLQTGRAPNGNDDGQFVTVADVYIDSFTATEELVPTFLYETTYLTARIDGENTDSSFNLDIKLHPSAEAEGYDYTHLDSFIDNIVLEYKEGAEVIVNKVGQFTSGSPKDWKWSVCPTTYSTTDTTSTLTASITYIDAYSQEQTKTWDFHLNINTRAVGGITANKFKDENGEDKEYISLNSDSSETDHIKLEEGMISTLTETGLLTHSYKYFSVQPQTGTPYSTFSLLKFFLPEGDSVTVPHKEGIYKLTFEFDAKTTSTQYSPISFNDSSERKGEPSFFKYNEDTQSWESSGSPAGQKGRYRVEQLFEKKNSTPTTFVFQDTASEIEVKNVLYYEQNSEYPFLEVNGVKVKTFFNSDSMVITRQLAELTVEGFGDFNIIACVVVSDNNGSIISSADGGFEKLFTKTINVRVTNSVKDLVLNILDSSGGTSGIEEGNFDSTVVVDENRDYVIYISPGPNTALEVLTQAVLKGTIVIEANVNGTAVDENGIVINSNSFLINQIEEDKNEDGDLIGYKFLIEVKNVFTIENARGESENVSYKLSIKVNGTNFLLEKTIEVRDHVVQEASISYDNQTSTSMRIYANNVSAGKVEWNEWTRQTSVDISKFAFVFESAYGEINVEPEITFETTHNVITTGIISAVKKDGKWGLELKNFPYYSDGVVVTIKMKYNGNSAEVNKRYVYDEGLEQYVLRSYENSEAEYNLTVYGFNITYNPKSVSVIGVKDEYVDILETRFVEPTIKTGKGSAANAVSIRDIVNFSMGGASSPDSYFSFDSTTTRITILKSITNPIVATVSLMIGNNTFATHNITFVSPFTVSQKSEDAILAPNASVNLFNYFEIKKDSVDIAASLISFAIDSETVLKNGKTIGDYVSVTGSTMFVKYVPFDFSVEVFVTVFEMNGDVKENKGTFDNMFISIVNPYATDNDIFIKNTTDNIIYGNGKNNYIDISDVYSGSDYTITMTFENHKLDPDDDDTQFVFAGTPDVNNFYSIYAYDIVHETGIDVTVTLNISIPGNGDTVAIFTITVKQYVTIGFKAGTPTLQSGTSTSVDITDIDSFSIKDNNGQNASIGGEGSMSMYLEIDIAPESTSLIEIATNAETKAIVAKAGITENSVAYVIITRKIYIGANPNYSYTIDYVLQVNVNAQA